MRLNRHGGLRVLAIFLRRVKTSGKSGIHGRARREERSENARKFLQLSARSPSAAIFRLRWLHWLGKPTRGNLLDSPPTNMPQEIPRVFSQRSRFYPLSDNLSPPLYPSFPFPFLPLSAVILVSPATRSSATLFHAAHDRSFSRPLQTLWILQGGDTAGLSKFHRSD